MGINAPNCSNETLAKLLDRYLCQLNDDYQTVRKTGLLSQVRVTTFSPQVFYDWQAKQGKLGGQAKSPTVMTDEQYADWVAFLGLRAAEK